MYLSLYTIAHWLRNRGYSLTEVISNGQPCISGALLQEDAEHLDDAYANILDAKLMSTGNAFQTVIVNGRDAIFFPDTDIQTIQNELAQIFGFYNAWYVDMLRHIATGGTLQGLIDFSQPVLNRPVCIRSRSSWAYALSKGYDASVFPLWDYYQKSVQSREIRMDTEEAVSMAPDFAQVFLSKYPLIKKSPYDGVGNIIHANVYCDQTLAAIIFALEDGTPFDPGEVHLMKVFTDMVELLIGNNKNLFLPTSGFAESFIELIKRGHLPSINISNIYLSKNWNSADEFAVCTIKCLSNNIGTLENILIDKLQAATSFHTFFLYDSMVIGIINITKEKGYEQAVQMLSHHISSEMFCWGLSFYFVGLEHLSHFYAQAVRVLNQAYTKNMSYLTHFQVAFELFAKDIQSIDSFTEFVHPDWLKLAQHDQANKTNLVQTLYTYLLTGCNFTETASLLKLHRNGVIYRIEKIKSMIESKTDEYSVRQLLLATYPLIVRPN